MAFFSASVQATLRWILRGAGEGSATVSSLARRSDEKPMVRSVSAAVAYSRRRMEIACQSSSSPRTSSPATLVTRRGLGGSLHAQSPTLGGGARVRTRGAVSPEMASSRRRGWSRTGADRSADDRRGVDVQRERCPSGSATRESRRACSETEEADGGKTSDRPASRSGGVAWHRSVGSARRCAPRLLHVRTNLRRVAVGRARGSRDPLGAHPGTTAAREKSPPKQRPRRRKPRDRMSFRRANGRRRRRGYVGRFRRRDVSTMRTIEGASRTTSIAVATRLSAASPAASRWREKEAGRKRREENGGVDDGVARTCGGIFGGAEGDASEDAPEEPPGHRAWVGGRRDARRGGLRKEAPRSARGQIVKGALGTTRPRENAHARDNATPGGKFEIRLRGRRGEFETGAGEIETRAGKFETESVPGRERSKPIRSPSGKFETEWVSGREISARKRVRRTSNRSRRALNPEWNLQKV